MAHVILYTTPTCVWCRRAKQLFQAHNVAYEEKNVVEDAQARQDMVEKSGQLGVPVIDIDGSIVIGYDEERLKELTGIKK